MVMGSEPIPGWKPEKGRIVDVKTLPAMLGHVSAATTLDIYTHITDDMQPAHGRRQH